MMRTLQRTLFSLLLAGALAACSSKAPVLVGTPCTSDDDCGDDRFCELQSPGGECSGVCEGDADDDEQCGEGSVCGKNLSGSLECKKECDADDDCRSGYACTGTMGTDRYCVPSSAKDAAVGSDGGGG